MFRLELKDSQINGQTISSVNRGNASAIIKAIDKLNTRFADGSINIINILSYSQPVISDESIISYRITDYSTLHNSQLPSGLIFYTSHYIGQCIIDDINIIILPRFGSNILNYILKYTANVYVAPGNSGSEQISNNFYWLIALLWKSMLNKALATGHTPKAYIRESRNIKSFRGRLNISRHIPLNLTDQSKFYCTFNKLTPNNTINRAVRYVYRLLSEERCNLLINEFAHYDERLASMGVESTPVDISDIDKIRYTRLNYAYKPLMNICRSIIANKNISAGKKTNEAPAYFIDIAELWEVYLLTILQKNLPDYKIYSPNTYSGDYLLEGNYREIRPDIIIEKNGSVVMIIDAKYKNYSVIGATAELGVSREDLYQMTVYLYHYGGNRPIIGIFSSPVGQVNSEKLINYTHNPLHKIGVEIYLLIQWQTTRTLTSTCTN